MRGPGDVALNMGKAEEKGSKGDPWIIVWGN